MGPGIWKKPFMIESEMLEHCHMVKGTSWYSDDLEQLVQLKSFLQDCFSNQIGQDDNFAFVNVV